LNAALLINVYTGADGHFDIYEDDGRSVGYEKGEWSRIPVTYDETSGTVTIGNRIGSFPAMAQERSISVRFISGADKDVANFDTKNVKTLQYKGDELSVTRN